MIRHRDGRTYIGSAVDIDRRLDQHLLLLRTNRHPNFKLQKAWHEDGERFFIWGTVQHCAIKDLIQIEQQCIEKYKVVESGFNIAPLAGRVTFGKSYHLRKRSD